MSMGITVCSMPKVKQRRGGGGGLVADSKQANVQIQISLAQAFQRSFAHFACHTEHYGAKVVQRFLIMSCLELKCCRFGGLLFRPTHQQQW